jgi:hypothetical protein
VTAADRLRGRARVAAALVLCGALGGLSSCAAERSDGAAPAAGGAGARPARAVRVGLSEWTIALAPPVARAGRITLSVTNAGATGHDLVVAGRDGSWATKELDPGQRTTLVVRGRAGERLHLWCSIPGHRLQGMDTHLPVRR